jgi:hypothetical protein
MGVTKHWLKGQSFARNIERTIDRESLLDLLGIVIYEADRSAALENAGCSDDTPAVDCLFDYVLDALSVPAETNSFSRNPFAEMFYNDYWLEKRYGSLNETLLALETLRDEMAERTTKADTHRARIRIVKPDDQQVE